LELRLSKSKIISYKDCPRKYYFKNFTTMGTNNKQTSQMFSGSLLHEYFEAWNRGDGSDKDYLEVLDTDFLKANANNFLKLHKKFGLGPAEFYEVKLEEPSEDFVGIIDAIYRKGDEVWIIDYKTGKYRDFKKPEYIFELNLYVFLVEKQFGMIVNKIGMFYTSEPDSSFVEPVNRSKVLKHMQDFRDYRKKILDCRFERKKTKLCPWCDYLYCCEDYRDEIIGD